MWAGRGAGRLGCWAGWGCRQAGVWAVQGADSLGWRQAGGEGRLEVWAGETEASVSHKIMGYPLWEQTGRIQQGLTTGYLLGAGSHGLS